MILKKLKPVKNSSVVAEVRGTVRQEKLRAVCM
jgi:hypothetical protein